MNGPRPPHQSRLGFSFVEVLIAVVVLALAGLVGAAYAVRGSSDADWQRDRVFAHQKAIAILAELRSLVDESGDAADLDAYDDDLDHVPTLTLTRERVSPYALVSPDHPISGNNFNAGIWRWSRTISVEDFHASDSDDRRLCTVRIFRRLKGETAPGTQMAEVTGVIQSMSDTMPGTQVYDLYVLAIDNVLSPWMSTGGMLAFMDSQLGELKARNPGLEFRIHWIRTLGYGRDDEYAPYTNIDTDSTAKMPWAYVYPGSLPITAKRATAFSPGMFRARYNRDDTSLGTILAMDWALAEPFIDTNGNGIADGGETYNDLDGDSRYDPGNPVPHAFADAHNHALRWPEAMERHKARVAEHMTSELTWRLLLDDMIRDPEAYENAMFLNLHGQVMPMPPVRNYSDAARSPEKNPGWRVVTHPERLRPERGKKGKKGGPAAPSTSPRFRVHAYKTDFSGTDVIMTQREPLVDANDNDVWDSGESYTDWNGNGVWDAGRPITLRIPGANLTARPNDPTSPSIRVTSLPGGVDSDGDGSVEPYSPFANATMLPEVFEDSNGDKVCDVVEPFFDVDGDGVRSNFEQFVDLDGNGTYSATAEVIADSNGNGTWDQDMPTEEFTDTNGNGRWDPAEPYWDMDGDGKWTPPTTPKSPYHPWNPVHYGNALQEQKYLLDYGEPFLDRDGDGVYDDKPEPLQDINGNGVHDTGYTRGEMYFTVRYDADSQATVLELHATPLEAPVDALGAGLAADDRLYDLEYVPCPTPATAASKNRFERDLATVGAFPKNTARWIVEIPADAIRTEMASAPGKNDGDQSDRLITVETRIGYDLGTGVLWPTRNEPGNCSKTYAWYADKIEDVPFSERFQFQGDPRHSPYADSDALGANFPNGYNPYFDSFATSGTDASGRWLAFDSKRLADRWARRADFDVPRFMDWLRSALTQTEAFYANLGGMGFEAMALGGEIAATGSMMDAGIPMSGHPFGKGGSVHENALFNTGDSDWAGTRKFIRDGVSTNKSRREGGSWWSKPWLGELSPDSMYASHWKLHGNLPAAPSTVGASLFAQVRRSNVPSTQLPTGTALSDARGELGVVGGTSFFHVGTSKATFQQGVSGAVGRIVKDGYELGTRYGVQVPTAVSVSHPFKLTWSGEGTTNGFTVGPEFMDTATFPRFEAEIATVYYAEDASVTSGLGAACVRHIAPDGKIARHVISSYYEGTEEGAAFHGRAALLSLVHAHANEGLPDAPRRVRQLPSIRVMEPRTKSLIANPSEIDVRWRIEWTRWDHRPYDKDTPDDFKEDDKDVIYRVLYSWNNGGTWFHMQDGSEAVPGVLRTKDDGKADKDFYVDDKKGKGDDKYKWQTPPDQVPDAGYLVRIEAHNKKARSHYAYKLDKFDVSRPSPDPAPAGE